MEQGNDDARRKERLTNNDGRRDERGRREGDNLERRDTVCWKERKYAHAAKMRNTVTETREVRESAGRPGELVYRGAGGSVGRSVIAQR